MKAGGAAVSGRVRANRSGSAGAFESSPRKLTHIPGLAGTDEAGRGPLAGPVVAAAVVLPADFDVTGIDDSKKLDRRAREELAETIRASADYAIVSSEVEEIDRINILWASMAAMHRAIGLLKAPFRKVLVDGNKLPKEMTWDAEAVVDGDATFACIAAASILAKVNRDAIMRGLAERYPEYGFEQHFGYPTPQHLEALRRHGPCELHRRSFQRIRDFYDQPCLIFDQ